MQGNNKTFCTFLCLHFLTTHRFSGFWGAQESSWGHGFSSETQNLSPLCSCIPSPSPSPLLKGGTLPSSCLSKPQVPDTLLTFRQGCHAVWFSRLLLTHGLFGSPIWDFPALWMPASVAKPYWISFHINPSICGFAVSEHQPDYLLSTQTQSLKIALNKISEACFLGPSQWLWNNFWIPYRQ